MEESEAQVKPEVEERNMREVTKAESVIERARKSIA
jgi:hypothetical protein